MAAISSSDTIRSDSAPLYVSADSSDSASPATPVPMKQRGSIGIDFKNRVGRCLDSALAALLNLDQRKSSTAERQALFSSLREDARYMSGAVDDFLNQSKTAAFAARANLNSRPILTSSGSNDSLTGELSVATVEGLVHELRADLQSILIILAEENPSHELIADLKEHYIDLLIELEDIPADQETRELSTEEKPFSIEQLARRTLSKSCAIVKQHRMEMSYHIEEGVEPTVIGDPRRLRQVLKNYTTNACKYAHKGKKIQLNISLRNDRELKFAIQDFGDGISKSEQKKLFQLFSQLEPSRGCCSCFSAGEPEDLIKLPSSGVGLSFCKTVAFKMNPDSLDPIGVRSKRKTFWNKQSGSEFYVAIPYLPTHAAPALTPSATPLAPSLSFSNNPSLLIVDDSETNRKMLSRMLSTAPFRLIQADGGQKAIETVQEAEREGSPIQALLLDVQMPEIDGPETAFRIYKLGLQKIPQIIFLSGQEAENVSRQVKAKGLDPARFTILSKPYNKKTLLEALNISPSPIE